MAVTVTYEFPVAGTTAPTAAQVADSVRANIIATADGDTVATVTHNMALSVAQLAAGQPIINLCPLTAAGALSTWSATTIATSTIVLTKSTAGGSGAAPAQLRVTVLRPHTIGQ